MAANPATLRHDSVQGVKNAILTAMSSPEPKSGRSLRDAMPADWLMEGLVLVLQSLLVDQNHELDVMWEQLNRGGIG